MFHQFLGGGGGREGGRMHICLPKWISERIITNNENLPAWSAFHLEGSQKCCSLWSSPELLKTLLISVRAEA